MTDSPKIDLFDPTPEHEMLRRTVRDFVRSEVEPQALQSDRSEHFNLDLFRKLGDLGLLGITVDEEFGGSGLDAVAVAVAHEEIASSDPAFCLAYLAHALLCTNNIAVNASKEQCAFLLPKLCTGEWVGAMAMSEPGAGTDVLNMSTRASLEGDHYCINGRKMWITNGTIDSGTTTCDVVLVYTRTDPPGSSKAQISSFVIQGSTAGFSVGQKIKDKLGMRASNTAELCFDNCRVPRSNLIGKEGESVKHMMRNLEIERLGLAAMGVGIARRALKIMVEYSNQRDAFGKKISHFGQIQRYIGESYAEYQAARSYVYLTAHKTKLREYGHRLDSDGTKLFASQAAKRICDRAIQVLGGYGYVGEYIVERLWRDAKLLEIGGGTLEAHQKNISNDLKEVNLG